MKKNNTYTKGQRIKGNKNKNWGSNWKKKQNKLRLKVKIEKTIVIKGSIKTIKNKKNKDQIEKHNLLQIRIEELNLKETKLILKSQW